MPHGIGTPSNTYKGSVEAFMEATPGVADAVFTTRPATLPSSRLSIDVAFIASLPSVTQELLYRTQT